MLQTEDSPVPHCERVKICTSEERLIADMIKLPGNTRAVWVP